jgi:hypothetical protein
VSLTHECPANNIRIEFAKKYVAVSGKRASVIVVIAMKTTSHKAEETKVKLGHAVSQNPTSTHTNLTGEPGLSTGETLETIAARATTVTIVLQQIRSYRADHPYAHGGLND